MLAFSEKNKSLLTRSRYWNAQQLWEAAFEALPGVTRITPDKYGALKKLLAGCDDADTYMTTPNYYCYTGRNGLWVYQENDAFIIVCWHPNTKGEILIFPQLAHTENDLLTRLLGFIPLPPAGLRIARARPIAALQAHSFMHGARRVTVQPVEENVLDWKYPVHVLDTAKVASLAGGKYMHTRNRLRQLKDVNVEIRAFDAVGYSRALENLLHRWAQHNAAHDGEYDELYAPYDSLFTWSLDPASGLKGIMIFVDGAMQAVGLWDVCHGQQVTANLFVNFCNVTLPGLSELLVVKSCELLSDEGVTHLNLGGSETPGLDHYKNKFSPAISLDLCSYQVLIEETAKPNHIV